MPVDSGRKNSRMASRAPGFMTRAISESPTSWLSRLRTPKATVTASTEPVRKGRWSASAVAAGSPVFAAPRESMGMEKSLPRTTASGYWRRASAATSMVPAQTSRSRSPGARRRVRTARLRQSWSTRSVMTRLSRS